MLEEMLAELVLAADEIVMMPAELVLILAEWMEMLEEMLRELVLAAVLAAVDVV